MNVIERKQCCQQMTIGLALGGLPWDQPNFSHQSSWVWALPGEGLHGPHFIFGLTCQQLSSSPGGPGKHFCSSSPAIALDPSVEVVGSVFPQHL